MKQSFYPGDIVKIVDDGHTYTSYIDFFDHPERRQYKPEYKSSCRLGKIGWRTNNSDIGTVVATGKHSMRSNTFLCVVKNDEKGYVTLISEEGLMLVSSCLPEIEEINLLEIL